MSETKKPIRIFVGSSKEALPIANAIHKTLDDSAEVTVWNQNVFSPSKGSIKALYEFINKKTDFAIIVYSPDDSGHVRNKEVQMARDNVILELGLCVGQLGMERTFIFEPKGVEGFGLPTDLDGITSVPYNSNRSDGNFEAMVSPGCQTIMNEIKKILPAKIKGEKEKVLTKENKLPPPAKQIIHPTPENERRSNLSDEEISIIKFLGKKDEEFSAPQISGALGIGITKTRYHIDNLMDKDFLHDHLFVGREREYSLSQEARKYLVENNLDE